MNRGREYGLYSEYSALIDHAVERWGCTLLDLSYVKPVPQLPTQSSYSRGLFGADTLT